MSIWDSPVVGFFFVILCVLAVVCGTFGLEAKVLAMRPGRAKTITGVVIYIGAALVLCVVAWVAGTIWGRP